MPKKIVYQKSETGITDFVYIDLLPEMKTLRQFNVNVIIILLLLVVSSFVLIYIPYRNATIEKEELNSLNNDLQHELVLTQEEVVGFEIDTSVIDFQEDINDLKEYRIDFNQYINDLALTTSLQSGRITNIEYDLNTQTINMSVAIVSTYTFNILNVDILNLDWVSSSQYNTPTAYAGAVEYIATYQIGVDFDAE